MVIGGVLCRDDCAADAINDLANLHPTRPSHWSYEWKNVRDRNLHRYEAFVDLFFKYNSNQCIDFSCVVIDCTLLDHATFNQGDGEIGFNKFLFQHLYRHFRYIGGYGARFWCYHDRRTSLYDLDEIRGMLNSKCFQQQPRFVHRYRELAFADKQHRPMLQFADVMIGAVGFAWNGKLQVGPRNR